MQSKLYSCNNDIVHKIITLIIIRRRRRNGLFKYFYDMKVGEGMISVAGSLVCSDSAVADHSDEVMLGNWTTHWNEHI